MQAIDLIYKVGVTEQSVDPATGQPTNGLKEYTDNIGNKLVINEYELLKNAMNKFDINTDDLFKRVEEEEEEKPAVSPQQPGDNALAPGTPRLDMKPNESNILAGVMNQ
jgi:hypothetical protein